MKKYITLVFLCAMSSMLTGQTRTVSTTKQTDESKMKQLINLYMNENLADFQSYDPISYSSLDSLLLPLELDSNFKSKVALVDSLMKVYDELYKETEDWIEILYKYKTDNWKEDIQTAKNKLLDYFDNTLTPAIDDAKQYKDSYIGKPIGLKTTHKYRAKNKFGGYEIYEYIFGFDKNISTIIIVDDNLK